METTFCYKNLYETFFCNQNKKSNKKNAMKDCFVSGKLILSVKGYYKLGSVEIAFYIDKRGIFLYEMNI